MSADMEQNVEDERLIIKYLLGELPDEEQEQVEDRYASDDDFFEELLIIESELIDKYLQGELSDRERERFETVFLRPLSRRERVKNARVMMKWIADVPNPVSSVTLDEPRPWWLSLSAFWKYRPIKLAAGFAVVALAFTASWIIIRNLQRPPYSPQQKVSFDLTPDAVRGGNELRTLEINSDVSELEFYLYLEKSLQGRFTATLQTSTGKIVRKEFALEAQQTPSGKAVILSLPANILSNDDYFIILARENDKGTPDIIAEYQFRVVRS
jgi:hypothetical protein